MKRSLKSLLGYNLKEIDGEIGEIVDFYFDDQSWTVRYVIVKTGNWFSGKKVLISPQAFLTPDWENKQFPVNLTQEQIKNSPDIDTDKPVSRQQEEQLNNYYPWVEYWGTSAGHGAGIFGAMPGDLYYENVAPDPVLTEPSANVDNTSSDQHLQSTGSITGYNIDAVDGEIGKVSDFLADDATWKIKFFIVETGSWFNSRKVLLSTRWIKEVNWENSTVVVDITREAVKNSPEFDTTQPVKEEAELKLFTYYGKPMDDQ